jgi:hypothetical protein
MREITERELEQVAGGDLLSAIAEALAEAAREALRRLAGPNA